jgi:hypothetical protein
MKRTTAALLATSSLVATTARAAGDLAFSTGLDAGYVPWANAAPTGATSDAWFKGGAVAASSTLWIKPAKLLIGVGVALSGKVLRNTFDGDAADDGEGPRVETLSLGGGALEVAVAAEALPTLELGAAAGGFAARLDATSDDERARSRATFLGTGYGAHWSLGAPIGSSGPFFRQDWDAYALGRGHAETTDAATGETPKVFGVNLRCTTFALGWRLSI